MWLSISIDIGVRVRFLFENYWLIKSNQLQYLLANYRHLFERFGHLFELLQHSLKRFFCPWQKISLFSYSKNCTSNSSSLGGIWVKLAFSWQIFSGKSQRSVEIDCLSWDHCYYWLLSTKIWLINRQLLTNIKHYRLSSSFRMIDFHWHVTSQILVALCQCTNVMKDLVQISLNYDFCSINGSLYTRAKIS